MASETVHRFTDEGDIYELPSLVAPTFCKFFVSQPQVFWCNATLTKLQVFCGAVVQCLSLLHNFIQLSLNSGSVQFQILLAESQGSLTLVSAGNKAKRLSSPNHTTKTIHHHHHHHHHPHVQKLSYSIQILPRKPFLNPASQITIVANTTLPK